MTTSTNAVQTHHHPAETVINAIVVGLTLVTAAVHLSLGGPLFTLNAIGYATLATLIVLPGPVAQVRWLVRLALMGFTSATIVGWILVGGRFPLAYVDKAVELVLVTFLAAEVWTIDGGPLAILNRIGHLIRSIASLGRNRRIA
jgi:hypothetical protein